MKDTSGVKMYIIFKKKEKVKIRKRNKPKWKNIKKKTKNRNSIPICPGSNWYQFSNSKSISIANSTDILCFSVIFFYITFLSKSQMSWSAVVFWYSSDQN